MISLDDQREIEQYQKALVEELQNILPRNKPKTTIELDFSVSGWTAEQISAVINKICEEHEGKRDIHIKFVGTVARREDS